MAAVPAGLIPPLGMSDAEFQRLLADFQSGRQQVLLLQSAGGLGKTQLAAGLAQRLTQDGWKPLLLSATPFQPISSGPIVAAAAALFQQQGLLSEAEILRNPLVGIEERMRVVTAVMHHKLACVLVLDGFDSGMDPITSRCLEPAMELLLADLLTHTQGLSRLLITCSASPVLDAPLSPVCRTVYLVADQPPPLPKRAVAALAALDAPRLAMLAAMTLFHFPMPVAGYCAVTESTPSELEKLLQLLEQQELAGCLRSPGTAPLWYFHPQLHEAVRKGKTAARIAKQQARAGEYLFALLNEQQQGELGLSWLQLALEAVGHLIESAAKRRQETVSRAVQCAAPISDYFSRHGFFREQEWLNRRLLALGEHPRPLYLTAMALLRSRRQAEAESLLERVLTFGDALFPKENALALFELAALVISQQPEKAKENLLRALAINQRMGDQVGQAVCHAQLGFWGVQQASVEVAQTHLEAALALCRTLQDQTGIAHLLPWTGELLWRLGDMAAARRHFQEALQLLSRHPNLEVEEQLHHRLAIMDLGEERFDQALTGFLRSLEIKRATKNQKGEAVTFFQLGRLAKAKGNEAASLRFLGLCHRIGQSLGDPDAEQALTLFYELAATALGLHRALAQHILDEVWVAYNRDSGQSLIARSFQNG
ncbi:MAG: hypothetical protein HQL90_05005 [Magnetococcales bacterium]|nr:hypothetical protein [Magnetococcales bacterium]